MLCEKNPEDIVLMVDARTMGSQPSGIGMYLYNFLKEIVKEKKIRVILVSDVDTSQEMQDMKSRGVEILLYGKKIFRSAGVFFYFHFVRKMAKKMQPDLFWEPNILIPLPMSGYKGKIILTIHDIFPITTPENYGMIYRIYFRLLLNQSIKQSDLILYDSDFSKKETEQYSKMAKDKKNFLTYVIIPKTQTFENWDQDTEDFFLYVGYLCKRKGTDTLIKAYREYAHKGGSKKLYLAGGVSDNEVLELLEETNALLESQDKEKITYLGYISKDEKQTYIANCACFLFPSRAEGFGMPIIEVMEYYRPIIASNLSIFEELIGNVITYYNRNDDIESEATELAQKMLEFENCENEMKCIDRDAYDSVMEQYLPEELGEKLIKCLFELI